MLWCFFSWRGLYAAKIDGSLLAGLEVKSSEIMKEIQSEASWKLTLPGKCGGYIYKVVTLPSY